MSSHVCLPDPKFLPEQGLFSLIPSFFGGEGFMSKSEVSNQGISVQTPQKSGQYTSHGRSSCLIDFFFKNVKFIQNFVHDPNLSSFKNTVDT